MFLREDRNYIQDYTALQSARPQILFLFQIRHRFLLATLIVFFLWCRFLQNGNISFQHNVSVYFLVCSERNKESKFCPLKHFQSSLQSTTFWVLFCSCGGDLSAQWMYCTRSQHMFEVSSLRLNTRLTATSNWAPDWNRLSRYDVCSVHFNAIN
jgi:hypothetical protein